MNEKKLQNWKFKLFSETIQYLVNIDKFDTLKLYCKYYTQNFANLQNFMFENVNGNFANTCALKVNLGSKLDDVIGERKEHK